MPFKGLAQTTTVRLNIGETATEHSFAPDNGYERLVEHFTRAARDPSFALHPAEDGLAQAIVMDALARSALQGGEPQVC